MPTPQPWTARVWREFHASTLTRAYRDVLLTLRTFRGAGGAIHPSHATLADRAKCGVRTVQRALRQAELLGLVDWIERRVRAAWRGHVRQHGGKCGVVEVATDHAATVAIWLGTVSISGGVSSAIASVCM